MASWVDAFIQGWQDANNLAVRREALSLDREKNDYMLRMKALPMKAVGLAMDDYKSRNRGVSELTPDIMSSSSFLSSFLTHFVRLQSGEIGGVPPRATGLATAPAQRPAEIAPTTSAIPPAIVPQTIGQPSEPVVAPNELVPLGIR